MMSELAEEQCVPCHGGVPPVKGAELEVLRENPRWWMAGSEGASLRKGVSLQGLSAGS